VPCLGLCLDASVVCGQGSGAVLRNRLVLALLFAVHWMTCSTSDDLDDLDDLDEEDLDDLQYHA
jgi:hypothetical protein